MMTGDSKWRTALLVASASVLALGSVAWLFPGETAALAGAWTLPALSLCALVLALGLAAEWPALMGMLVVLAIVVVLGWNRPSATSTSHFAGICLGFLAMVAIGRAGATPRRLRLAMLLTLICGLAMLGVGLAGASVRTLMSLDWAHPVGPPMVQLGLAGLEGGGVNANALAAAVLLVMPLGMAVVALRSSEQLDRLFLRPLGFSVVVMGGITLAVCQSRSAWTVVWLIVVGVLVRGTTSRFARAVAGVVVVAPLVLAIIGVQFLSQKTFVTAAEGIWMSVHGRSEILAQGVQRWRESPWIGIGLNQFRSVYTSPAGGDVAHAHNMFLQTALDVGVVGSAAYWGIVAFLLVRAGRAARGASGLGRSAAVGSALSLVAVSLFGLSDAIPLGTKIGMFQWVAGGLILAASRVQSNATGHGAG